MIVYVKIQDNAKIILKEEYEEDNKVRNGCSSAFCVVGLGSHTQAAMAAEETTIENGISIGNVNVGGMTENQAISAVEEYVDGLMDTTFTLKGETGSIQMTAEDMGVTADADTAVQEALAVGHAGSLINRYKTLQDLKKEKSWFSICI